MAKGAVHNVEPICVECGKLARQVDGSRVWPHRRDLYDRVMWLCECGAYVGSHPGTDIPLGYPAGMRTRQMRQMVHVEFDFLWGVKMAQGVSKSVARAAAYAWLAREMGIQPAACHMAHFNEAEARRAYAIVHPVAERLRASRSHSSVKRS